MLPSRRRLPGHPCRPIRRPCNPLLRPHRRRRIRVREQRRPPPRRRRLRRLLTVPALQRRWRRVITKPLSLRMIRLDKDRRAKRGIRRLNNVRQVRRREPRTVARRLRPRPAHHSPIVLLRPHHPLPRAPVLPIGRPQRDGRRTPAHSRPTVQGYKAIDLLTLLARQALKHRTGELRTPRRRRELRDPKLPQLVQQRRRTCPRGRMRARARGAIPPCTKDRPSLSISRVVTEM